MPNVPDKLSVKISFPPFNQRVPLGELPVFGSSSDNESANCEVYLDWNNDNAFHQAKPGLGGYSGFSTWLYVYSEKNHLIVNGTNDLTAKMLCSVDNNFNLTRYNSIKIIVTIFESPKISSCAGLFYQTFKINSTSRSLVITFRL